MKDRASKHINRPFKNLKTLLKRQNISLSAQRREIRPQKPKVSPLPPLNESELFLDAMSDVTPLTFNKTASNMKPTASSPSLRFDNEDQDTVAALRMLIQKGHGFIVSQTPEYMESANPGVSAEILRRLHQGQYAIQDFIDLHGLRVEQAESVLKRFIKQSIKNNLRAVLIIHGRGLTSPKEPVLKKKVFSWLTRGPLRKWVIALTSARNCDGGTGATYVLLRRRPLTKSQRRKTTSKRTI